MLDELLDRLAALPAEGDAETLRVYADQLIERGDLRGELIVVATERLTRDTPELARRERIRIAEQEQRLAGVLATKLWLSYTWRLGFVDTITCNYHGDERFDVLPGLAAEPAARLLRRIQISAVQLDGDGDMAPILAELARLAPRFPRLTELAVHEGANLGNPWIDGPIKINDVTPLYAAFPRLEVLELDGDQTQLGELDLPSVRRFMATGLRVDDTRRLVNARWPRLADLELAFGAQRIDNVAASFGPLLHRDFGPGLVALSFALPPMAMRFVVDELPGSPLARHARRLAFRHGELDEGCFQSLIRQAPQLRRLERLELVGRQISAVTRKQLATAFGAALALR